jgi:hypothetical protein
MGKEFPREIIFFDTETTEIPQDEETELVLNLGVACHLRYEKTFNNFQDKKYYTFNTVQEFWNIVLDYSNEKTKLYLVAHNVAFDFRVVKGFENLKRLGYQTKKVFFKATMGIYCFTKKGHNITVLDNMNYFKSSLKVLGHSIGREKMEMPTNIITTLKGGQEKLIEYCKNDVDIMIEAWELFFKFLNNNDLGNFSKTIASQAFSAFRHRFMKHEIYVHNNEYATKLERESYHGGRTECFYIGRQSKKKTYFLLDVNSMYPSVMAQYDYPVKFIKTYRDIGVEIVQVLLKTQCLTARVIVSTTDPVFATKQRDKLIFPTGIFETVLTTREIEYGIANNLILAFKEVLVYNKANLFSEYVDFFYKHKVQYKREGNEAFSYLCKIFLNSLYGKFGQRNEAFKKIEDTDEPEGSLTIFDMDKMENSTVRIIGGVKEESIGMVEGFDSVVSIASHVTADARMKLWNYFKIAHLENVYYCDTDSMIVNMQGMALAKKYIGDGLGMLSLKEQSEILVLHGAKDYIFGRNEVIKGIKKDAEIIDERTFSQMRFEGMAGAIRNGRANKMFISKITKTLKRDYDKGMVIDGKVVPFKLSFQDKIL